MSITTYVALLIVLLFIVPGFIIDSVLRRFIPLKSSQGESNYLRLLLISCYHYGIYAVPLYYIFAYGLYKNHPLLTFFSFLIIMFLSPLLIGLFLVFLRNKKIHERAFRKMNFKSIKSIPVAWDYFFSTTESLFVTVYFKDGTTVSGVFGESSYASSITAERDLYLETTCEVNEAGEWEINPNSKGILIKSDEIKAIDFFKGGE